MTVKAYSFTVDIFDGAKKLASHSRCYKREQDLFDPFHYLPLIELKPGSFDYVNPPMEKRVAADLPADVKPTARNVARWARSARICQDFDAS